MKNVDLDNTMDMVNQMEAKESGRSQMPQGSSKTRIGTVESYLDRIGVVAIKLTGSLKVGDIIEIGHEDDAVRQRISSMQINRENIEEAGEGDSVGIKLKYKVDDGLPVYKIDNRADMR